MAEILHPRADGGQASRPRYQLAPRPSKVPITTTQSARTLRMTRSMTSFGTATQPPVQGFCGPKQCRKIAEPRPGAPSSLKPMFRQYW